MGDTKRPYPLNRWCPTCRAMPGRKCVVVIPGTAPSPRGPRYDHHQNAQRPHLWRYPPEQRT